jgi:hypothetical protein
MDHTSSNIISRDRMDRQSILGTRNFGLTRRQDPGRDVPTEPNL